MDPDETLDRILSRIEAINRGEDINLHTDFLCIEFDALNEWLKSGGFFPKLWMEKR
jgi:hypothetical protein